MNHLDMLSPVHRDFLKKTISKSRLTACLSELQDEKDNLSNDFWEKAKNNAAIVIENECPFISDLISLIYPFRRLESERCELGLLLMHILTMDSCGYDPRRPPNDDKLKIIQACARKFDIKSMTLENHGIGFYYLADVVKDNRIGKELISCFNIWKSYMPSPTVPIAQIKILDFEALYPGKSKPRIKARKRLKILVEIYQDDTEALVEDIYNKCRLIDGELFKMSFGDFRQGKGSIWKLAQELKLIERRK